MRDGPLPSGGARPAGGPPPDLLDPDGVRKGSTVGGGYHDRPDAIEAPHMKSILPILFVTASALAQGTFVPFGAGCPFNNQTPAIGNQGLPQVGNAFSVTYSGPNFQFSSGQQIAQPILVLGLTTQLLPIPPGFFPQQPAGCDGLISGDVFLPMAPDPRSSAFFSSQSIPVPGNPTLVGLTVFAQWICVVQQCGFAGCGLAAVITSDAAAATIGP